MRKEKNLPREQERSLKEVAEDYIQMRIQKIQSLLVLNQLLQLEKLYLKKALRAKATKDSLR